jgi:hypothetical protein
VPTVFAHPVVAVALASWFRTTRELRWVVLPAALLFACGWLVRRPRKVEDRR